MASETAGIARRDLLRKGLILGGAGTAAGLLVTSNVGCATAQEAGAVTKVTFDVACLGDTLRIQPTEGNEEGDTRGNTFSVEGHIYAADTIPTPGDGFDPSSEDAIGTWLCRGWFLINPDRPNPHVITTQEYVLAIMSDAQPFAADNLVSSGTEGTDEDEPPPIRSVIGGTGRYAGATGVVVQRGNGRNSTELRGVGANAPNFRFEFHLSVPQLDIDLGMGRE